MGKEALLITDMLNDFIRPDGALSIGPSGPAIVPNIKRELDKARAEGCPVIYVCDHHRPDDAEFQIWPPHCLAGTKGAEVISELAPKPDEYIVYKRRYSAFNGTDLNLLLGELGVDTITLTGCCTNICVLYTSADARMLNYEVKVPRDCVATFDAESQAFALKELENTLAARIIE